MNAGNLLPVAKAARAAWPGADLVICADNDRKTAGNPGLTAATAAAKAVGARLAVPEFPEGASGSDFNDLANLRKGAA
jgi:putative DNA primase/helicase